MGRLGAILYISLALMTLLQIQTVAAEDSDCNLDSDIVKFQLYEKNQTEAKANEICSIKCSPSKSSMIIIHGFNTDMSSPIWRIKGGVFDHFKNVENVIYVDWHVASQEKLANYHKIVSKVVPQVYNETFRLLEYLHQSGCRNIGMIGHSLGAHISGKSARLFKLAYNTSVDVIIGLDPAGPNYDKNLEIKLGIGFSTTFRRKRGVVYPVYQWSKTDLTHYLTEGLSKDDANHVIVIHTDSVCLGIAKDIGDVDIYLNDGYGQPGCCFPFCPPKFLGYMGASGCSHSYAVERFSSHEVIHPILQAYPQFRLDELPTPAPDLEITANKSGRLDGGTLSSIFIIFIGYILSCLS